jgi:hypothetical protein
MNAAHLVRLIIYTPIVAGGGVYCWRHGIRWSKNITIKGLPAKIGALILFIAASLMFLSILFPDQAEHLVDSLDKRFGGPPRNHHQGD